MRSEADNWKWWYFAVAGILIIGFGNSEFYTLKISKGIGSVSLAAACVAIGLFSRAAEARKAQSEKTEVKR